MMIVGGGIALRVLCSALFDIHTSSRKLSQRKLLFPRTLPARNLQSEINLQKFCNE